MRTDKNNFTRREFLRSGVIGTGMLVGTSCMRENFLFGQERVGRKHPNVIFILTDDQAWNTAKCWGGNVFTPNIDSIAANGVLFTNAHASSTVCAPSRYACLSGRYAGRCSHPEFIEANPKGKISRIDNSCISLEENCLNVAKVLKNAGYKTGMVGKWHLGSLLAGGGWEELGLKKYGKDANPTDPAVSDALRHNHERFCGSIKKHGFDYATSVYWANPSELRNDELHGHNLEWVVKGALDFIDRSKEAPFFLYFSTTHHHGPHPSLSIDRELITGAGKLEKPIEGVMPRRATIPERLKQAGVPEDTAYCTWLDDGIGALLAKLDALKLTENTVIMYFSDHGILAKSSLYDGGTHAPFMMQWKGRIDGGQKCNHLVQNTDFVPTILDACGVPVPDGMQLDGMSVLPLAERKDITWRASIFSECGFERGVRTDRWKYIAVRYPEAVMEKIRSGEMKPPLHYFNPNLSRIVQQRYKHYLDLDQLYDLKNDPREQKNLALDPAHAEKLAEMKRILSEYLKKFPDRPFGELTG